MGRRYLINFDARNLPRRDVDYLIVGGGIAGFYTAWKAAQTGAQVTLLTKRSTVDCNSQYAQGGIAVVMGEDDSVEAHVRDTLAAGAGLCWQDAVKLLVEEGPSRVRELIELGVAFDRDGSSLAMTREGGHSLRRVLHARGDATGAEILRVLEQRVISLPNVQMLEHQHVVDLLVESNVCYGALAIDTNSGGLMVYKSRIVVLATGGAGQLYTYTTNPEIATGDGIALAYRAGAEVMDMEFVQFHPTSLVLPNAPRFLISEAVRGEGALLRNILGERFMPQYHSMAELAPRDVVSRAILSEMAKNGADCVYLDLTHLNPEKTTSRFPTITATCARHGLDITKDLLPVAPAAHYIMGGVKTNLWGQTSIERLFCCGETSCLGMHGANRLASNSLLDCIVIGNRIVHAARSGKEEWHMPRFYCDELLAMPSLSFYKLRTALQQMMTTKVGPLRTGEGLEQALDFFDAWSYLEQYEMEMPLQMEVTNMFATARLIAQAALMRTESRGGHFRLDCPESKRRWQQHILLKW